MVTCRIPPTGDTSIAVDLGGGQDRIDWIIPAGFADIDASGGDGNDNLRVQIDGDGQHNLRGGAGDDVLTGRGLAHWSLSGDSGNDTLIGGAADDVLAGGSGDDDLEGNGGNDQMSGQDGADRLSRLVVGGPDTQSLNGGDGVDTLDLRFEVIGQAGGARGHAEISLDGVANDRVVRFDGVASPVTLAAVENIIGTTGDDVLTGSSGANVIDGQGGDDTIRGAAAPASRSTTSTVGSLGSLGALPPPPSLTLPSLLVLPPTGDVLAGSTGSDVLHGGAGADTLDGGPQPDVIDAAGGDDTILSRDPFGSGATLVASPDQVGCGAGIDGVTADLQDVLSDCENADVANVREGPVVRLARRVRADRRGVVAARISCPRRVGRRCAGRLTLFLAGHARSRPTSYRVSAGATTSVVIHTTGMLHDRLVRGKSTIVLLKSAENGRFGVKRAARTVLVTPHR